MSAPLTVKLEEAVDEKELEHAREHAQAGDREARDADSAASKARTKASGWADSVLEYVALRSGYRRLIKLAQERGNVKLALEDLPGRMHMVSNQTQLLLELVEDYRTGDYRQVKWPTVAVGAAALAYVVSPIDLVPDVLGAVGVLDDLAIMALASKLVRKEMEAFCDFKGYPREQYFAASAA